MNAPWAREGYFFPATFFDIVARACPRRVSVAAPAAGAWRVVDEIALEFLNRVLSNVSGIEVASVVQISSDWIARASMVIQSTAEERDSSRRNSELRARRELGS